MRQVYLVVSEMVKQGFVETSVIPGEIWHNRR